MISIKETGSDETRGDIIVDKNNQEVAGQKDKSTANFVMKWKESKRDCNISIVSPKGFKPTPVSEQAFSPIAAFECRGCEPYEYSLEGDWEVKSTGGTIFQGVDLSDEWTDYDEKSQCSVSVFKARGRFVLRRDLS